MRGRVPWIIAIVFALIIAIVLIRIGYAYKWTGFGQSSVNANLEPAKTLWDWLDLLIVSAVLAVLGFWFNRAQRSRDEYIQSQRAEDDALEKYLDYASKLLVDNHKALGGDISAPAWSESSSEHAQLNEDEVFLRETLSTVLRARTLAVMTRLNESYRKVSIVAFLYESGLIVKSNEGNSESFVALGGADLQGIDLSGATLLRIDLSSVYLNEANLSGAYLGDANLNRADLSGAYLRGAALGGAYMGSAVLVGAMLVRSDLGYANLSSADLRGADLSGADLSGANLQHAKLAGAHLGGASIANAELYGAEGITKEELERQAKTLEGITMPDGSKHG